MIDFDANGKNKYYSLYKTLREDIISGKMRGGERLPSKRALARMLGVSVTTVMLAYGQLAAEGYVCPRERSGHFVEKLNGVPNLNKKSSPLYGVGKIPSVKSGEETRRYSCDLVKGVLPAQLFPFSTWARLMRRVLNDCGEHLLERVPKDGDAQLKYAISAYLFRSRGMEVDPRFIVVGAGAEYLYGVIVQLLGRDKPYAVENPCYTKIPSVYALNGAKCLPVAVGEKGMDLRSLGKLAACAAHVSPSHQFPTGAIMPASVRAGLIDWANSVDGFIIEDDYDSEFRLEGKPLHSMQSLCPSRVVYVNTFSKSLAPSMRLGYAVLPPVLYDKFMRSFPDGASSVSLFEQKTLAAMLDGGYFERHVSRLKNYYRTVRGKLLDKLAGKCEVYDTGAGLHLVARFPSEECDEKIKLAAAERGVRLKCLSDYLISPRPELDLCAVINYSGLTSEQLD